MARGGLRNVKNLNLGKYCLNNTHMEPLAKVIKNGYLSKCTHFIICENKITLFENVSQAILTSDFENCEYFDLFSNSITDSESIVKVIESGKLSKCKFIKLNWIKMNSKFGIRIMQCV